MVVGSNPSRATYMLKYTRPNSRYEKIKLNKPLSDKVFTENDAVWSLEHIEKHTPYGRGYRFICSLLGTLYEELSDKPHLQQIVLECVWMACRMNAKLNKIKAKEKGVSK